MSQTCRLEARGSLVSTPTSARTLFGRRLISVRIMKGITPSLFRKLEVERAGPRSAD